MSSKDIVLTAAGASSVPQFTVVAGTSSVNWYACGAEGGNGVTVDSAGNIYFLIYSGSTLVLYKYSSAGVQLAAQSYTLDASTEPSSSTIKISPVDNTIYFTVLRYGTGLGIIKLNTNLTVAWSKVYNPRSQNTYSYGTVNDLLIDSSGDLYICGKAAFQVGQTSETRAFFMKVNPSNGNPVWSVEPYGGQSSEAGCMTFDNSGNIVILGSSFYYSSNYYYDFNYWKYNTSGSLIQSQRNRFGSEDTEETSSYRMFAYDCALNTSTGEIRWSGFIDIGGGRRTCTYGWLSGMTPSGYGYNFGSSSPTAYLTVLDPNASYEQVCIVKDDDANEDDVNYVSESKKLNSEISGTGKFVNPCGLAYNPVSTAFNHLYSQRLTSSGDAKIALVSIKNPSAAPTGITLPNTILNFADYPVGASGLTLTSRGTAGSSTYPTASTTMTGLISTTSTYPSSVVVTSF